MKKLLATFLTLTALAQPAFAEKTASGCEHPFTDLKDHWGAESICSLYDEGVVNGYSEKTFSPNTQMSRAEFVKILVRSMGYNVYAVQSAAFTDQSTDDWHYAVVSFAHSKGLVSGYADGSFHPNDHITRAEALELLVNASGIASADTSDLSHRFYDVTGDDWFATSLAIGLENGIVKGYGDGSFRPHNSITRAEACEMLVKALNTIIR